MTERAEERVKMGRKVRALPRLMGVKAEAGPKWPQREVEAEGSRGWGGIDNSIRRMKLWLRLEFSAYRFALLLA